MVNSFNLVAQTRAQIQKGNKMIKIAPENKDAISKALRAVNGKSEAHTFTHYHEIERIALEAEQMLERLNITKKDRVGACYIAQSGSELPSGYKYAAQTTSVALKRRASGWYWTEAHRSYLYPRDKPYARLKLTKKQDAIAVAALRRAYIIAA